MIERLMQILVEAEPRVLDTSASPYNQSTSIRNPIPFGSREAEVHQPLGWRAQEGTQMDEARSEMTSVQ
jgi:hypothetical protein